jgi:phenylalanyl-tRNA synthetase beta chain
MKISLDWLKEFVDVDIQLPELLERLTMIGLIPAGTEEKNGDVVLDLETYANRPDTLGHLGMAREIGAMLGRPLKETVWPIVELPVRTEEVVDVQILDDDLCPRYCGLVVKGVSVGPSPDWLRTRVEAMGLRPINNVVDASNYVLFATGQPIHTFDLAKVEGLRVLIRRSKKGETLRTLEGKVVTLAADMLVIADEKKPMAIAGVMGGEDSGISEATKDVFIESAVFDPSSIRRTRKALDLLTDASYRFERGADISFAPQAAVMIASLLNRFGGRVSKGVLDVYPKPRKVREIVLRTRRIADLLGIDVGEDFIERTLGALGFALKTNHQGAWRVQVPFHRVDIEREADLIEEVARFFGYDKIPSAVPPLEILESGGTPRTGRMDKIRHQLFHYGFDEVINQSFADPEVEARFRSGKTPVEIRNPMSTKASVLRTSLLPGLLQTTAWNRNRERESVHIFEVGNVYERSENGTFETLSLGLSSTGPFGAPHWKGKPAEADLFRLKGALEAALEVLRYVPFSFEAGRHPFFEEETGLRLAYKGVGVGFMGQVRQALGDDTALKGPVFAAELDLGLLFEKQPGPFEVAALPKYPSVVRDLSFLVDHRVPYGEVVRTIEKTAVPNLESFALIDRYAGDRLPMDAVSLSLRFIYRSPKGTLMAEDVDKAEEKILKALKAAFQIQLREGGST